MSFDPTPLRLAVRVLLFLVCTSVAVSAVAAKPKKLDDEALPPFDVRQGSWCPRHCGQYDAPNIQWQLDPRVPDAVAVFADPLVPDHLLVATGSGLVETRDQGRSWKANAAASANRIGLISSILFRPDSTGCYYVGSKTRGLWQTLDGGKTFKLLASKATGLASDYVLAAYISPTDALFRTLLVIHGEEAPGLSKSVDNGRTWELLYPDYHILRIAFNTANPGRSGQVILVAAPRQHPENRNIYDLPSLQEPWQTLISDTICTGIAEPVLRRNAVYLATADKGLFKVTITGDGCLTKNVGPLSDPEWASFGATWGATADSELFYAYDPKKLGLVLFTTRQLDPSAAGDDQPAPPNPAAPYTTQSRGLFTGPLVLEGAHVRANANGTCFYAAVNKSLYVGRRTSAATLVAEVSVDPPLHEVQPDVLKEAYASLDEALDAFSREPNVVLAARRFQPRLQEQINALNAHRITVTAKIAYPTGHPPKSVTVDLSRLGFSPRSPMIAVRRPAEPTSGEGVYTGSFSLDSPNFHGVPQDWRSSWTGIVGLTVSAAGDDGSLAGAVGVLGVQLERPAGVPFWTWAPSPETGNVRGGMKGGVKSGVKGGMKGGVKGGVKGSISRLQRRDKIAESQEQQITILNAGPWSVRLNAPRESMDITGFYAISFLIHADRELTDDIAVSLRDRSTYAYPTTSSPVFLIKDKLLPLGKITRTPQRVTIPVSRWIKDPTGFEPTRTGVMILAGKSSGPAEILIGELRCYPSAEALPNEEEEP